MAIDMTNEYQVLLVLLLGWHDGEDVLTFPLGYEPPEDIVTETELQQL